MSEYTLASATPATVSAFREDLGRGASCMEWRLDAFAHEAILRARAWRHGERILDVGCGYSTLPSVLADRFGVEAWGCDVLEGFWERPCDSVEGASFRFIRELVGSSAASALPDGYFDVVYSKLAVHFTPCPQDAAWRHMASLVRPGGELIIIAGTASPFEHDPRRLWKRAAHVHSLEKAAERVAAMGKFAPQFWRKIERLAPPRLISPHLYCAYAMNVLGARGSIPSALHAHRYFFDHDTFYDPFFIPALRACFEKNPDLMGGAGRGRTGAVIMRFTRRDV